MESYCSSGNEVESENICEYYALCRLQVIPQEKEHELQPTIFQLHQKSKEFQHENFPVKNPK